MAFGALEILALILIVLAIVKTVVMLIISPKAWFRFAKAVYANPVVVSIVALILAAVVLYYLVGAGVTIVHILAVMVFLALLATVGFAKYANNLIKFFEKKKVRRELRKRQGGRVDARFIKGPRF